MRLSPLFLFALLLSAALTLSSCKKKPAPSSLLDGGPGSGETIAFATPAEAAAKLGFAAKLPLDTEAYVSSQNLPAHAANLKKSNWAKDVDGFLEDKTPVPAANATGLPGADALMQLWGKDFFIAVGKGGSAALKPWNELMSLNTEMQYTTMMRGRIAPAPADAKQPPAKLMSLLSELLGNDDLLRRASDVIAKLTLPPLMIGVQTEKPEDVLKQLVPEALMTQAKSKAKVSQFTAATGSFTIIEGTFAVFLTNEMKKEMLAQLPPDRPGITSLVSQTLDAVQTKKFCLTYGTSFGHLVVAIGEERPNLEFATDPAKSLLARPEMAFIIPYASQNLVGIAFAQGDVLNSLQNNEPMQPIARGMIAGLKSSPMFGPMAASLEPKVKELAALERELQGRKLTTTAAVAWWDKGLRVEMKGGMSTEGLEGKKQLKFAPLIDDASVLFGIAYHGDPELTGKARKLFEAWAVLLHGAAQELVKAGLGGKDGPTIAKWIESDIIPNAVSFYDGTKTIFQKGIGNEHAVIIDMEGKAPALPIFLQEDGQPGKMLRIAGLDTVAERGSIGSPWDSMQESLNKVAAAFPVLAGAKLPEPVQNSQPGGLSSYSYELLPGAEDLSPCVSVSDSLFFMGTSVPQHGQLASRLLRAKPHTENTTMRWRLNFPLIRNAVKVFSTNKADASNADQMKSTTRWLAPLGEASGRLWIEAGNVRNSITISVKDVQRFD